MSKTITVHNKSGQTQTFLVHGWNGNKNIDVPARGKVNINAPDGSSGAIIAVHGGVEGEQAEITKKGFGGNDFFDISYIVGLGGNLTIMQAGDRSTLKGHPTLMQACNAKWQKTDQGTKNAIKGAVHLDNGGKVVRVDKPASNPKLEEWVRTFAGGYGYVGVGSWNGNNGHQQDNQQSSAAKGNKDILVTYNDGNGDANPGDAPASKPNPAPANDKYTIKAGDTFWSVAQAHKLTVQQIQAANPGVDAAKLKTDLNLTLSLPEPDANFQAFTLFAAPEGSLPPVENGPVTAESKGDALIASENGDAAEPATEPVETSDGEVLDTASLPEAPTFPAIGLFAVQAAVAKAPAKGPGIDLTNKGKAADTYFFFDNYWNGNGTAGANFDKPLKNVRVEPGKTVFVPLPMTFKGRVQRGKLIPATWVEFQLQASDDKKAHGDISVQQGNDGPAMIRSTDGTNVSNGFTKPISAPPAAMRKRADGKMVIDTTMGNWMGGPNQAAIKAQDHIRRQAYVQGGSGVPDVASANNRMAVEFY
ncbi:LysM domain-containing protein 1 [Elsinoe fawcettii]|nr:LysM domain-containing protein 1 [Elsinoe fawcettii]